MILHIAPDDKFIDMAYKMFENISPYNNEFVVVTEVEKFKYIITTPITKMRRGQFLSKNFLANLVNYEFVVIHVLTDDVKKMISNADKSIKFVWIGWGSDYYCYTNKVLLLPQTRALKEKIQNSKNFYDKILLRSLRSFVIHKLRNKSEKKIFNKINYFAPVLYEDYLLVKNELKIPIPKYLDWNYGTLEDDLIGNENIEISGENILLGNSASFENNHLEAIDLLKYIGLGNKKVICPLSYGDEHYANKVISYGKKNLGQNFEPLTIFMKIHEYNKIITTCSVVIMNHFRQQALGNIITMMYSGAKVYLNKENPVYQFFLDKGAIIYSIDELEKNPNMINVRLFQEEIEINRKILKNFWSRNVAQQKTKRLIDTMIRGNNV